MAKRVLIVATVVKKHIIQFHVPTIRMLKDMGWEVDVAARNDYENPEDCRIPFIDNYYNIPIDRKPLSNDNRKAYKSLKKIIADGRYDVVHCHTPMGGFLTRMAAKDARKNGTKVFYTVHGFHFFRGASLKNWLLYYPAEKYCSIYTDILITICDEDYELAKKKMRARCIAKIPGIGINVEKFDDSSNRDLEKNERILLSVGELIKRKNHEAVIRAMASTDDARIRYFIAGDGELKGYLENLIRELHLEDRVKLLGYIDDIKELFKAADLYIQPSFQEGLPVAVMEAMASGVSVVASDVRGNRDLIQQDMLFNPKNVDEIKSAVLKYIYRDNSDIELHNKETIKEYDECKVLDILRRLYEEI